MGKSDKERKFRPIALIGVGACFMGSGAAISAALSGSGAGVGGGVLVVVGALFMILGLTKKREQDSGQRGDDDDRPNA